MSTITLFGTCALDAESFAAMAPHVQTEALRLMTERCYSAADVEEATGLCRRDLMERGRASYQFSLKNLDRDTAPQSGERPLGLSGTARLVLLQMQSQAGTLAASLNSIGYDLGKSPPAIRDALKQLVGRELIVLTEPAVGARRPAQYRITQEGEALAATLAALPLKVDADA